MKRTQKRSGGRACTRARHTLLELPPELLARVFALVNVRDIGSARQVCRSWRTAVDKHESALWVARCNVLGVLPVGARGVLGTDVAQTIARAEDLGRSLHRRTLRAASRRMVMRHIANVYRDHYFRWARHVCKQCDPVLLCSTAQCLACKDPSTFRWVSSRAVSSKILPAVRSSYCAYVPYAPLRADCRGTFVRMDDVFDYYCERHVESTAKDVDERLRSSHAVLF